MTATGPTHYLWWLVSRASGIVAVTLVSIAVLIGLAMAAKLVPPRSKRGVVALHEQVAMTALCNRRARWLTAGRRVATSWSRRDHHPVPAAYRPAFTGAGIIAGYLAILLGPTFYLRRRIGARMWRRLHRVTPLIWVLAAVHTLGAGSDASSPWLRGVVLLPVAPIAYLLTVRVFSGRRRDGRQRPAARSRVAPAAVAADEAG